MTLILTPSFVDRKNTERRVGQQVVHPEIRTETSSPAIAPIDSAAIADAIRHGSAVAIAPRSRRGRQAVTPVMRSARSRSRKLESQTEVAPLIPEGRSPQVHHKLHAIALTAPTSCTRSPQVLYKLHAIAITSPTDGTRSPSPPPRVARDRPHRPHRWHSAVKSPIGK